MKNEKYQVINTWNGGEGGVLVEFVSTDTGTSGHNECFDWIIKNTPFSYSEATTNQGYAVLPTSESLEKRAG